MSSQEEEHSTSEEESQSNEEVELSQPEEDSPNGTTNPDNSKKSATRARAEAQWPSDKMIVTAIGEDGRPLGKKERLRMRKLAGLIGRQKVSLLLPNFGSMKKA